jgi:tetratricopeptide (TPR) repeat protein
MPKRLTPPALLKNLLKTQEKPKYDTRLDLAFQAVNQRSLQANIAGDWAQLEQLNQQAFDLNFEHPHAMADTWFFRGLLDRKNKAHPAAEKAFKLAISLNPKHPAASNSLGLLYVDLDRLDDAYACYQNLLANYPNDTNANCNLAILYFLRYQHQAAVQLLLECLKREPKHKVIHHSLGIILLAMGDYKRGWHAYEWRIPVNQNRYGFTQAVVWQGEPLENRILLIHAEQGFGDSLQFVRYIPLIHRKHPQATILFIAPPLLHRLFAPIEGISQLISSDPGTVIPAHHFQCALLSTPKLMGTTSLEAIPNQLPYLSAPKTNRLAARQGRTPRIGMCWSGRDEHTNDRHRSMTYERVKAFLTQPIWAGKVEWVVLQRDRRAPDLAQQARDYGWHDPFAANQADYTDFYDSAQLVQELDLTITIDSALAHLAGGLARPVWVLLPYNNPDWRWFAHRKDSPWYPKCMSLFRQPKMHDWDTVLQQVTLQLGRALGINAAD